jgi:hypothetical protein
VKLRVHFWAVPKLVTSRYRLPFSKRSRGVVIKHRTHSMKLLNSMDLVGERTMPTERPPLVGEVSANFLRIEGVTW